MLRATFKSLLARKLRLVLSALSVVIGVAFVAGTFVLTDTLNRTFDNLFQRIDRGTSVEVRGATAFDTNNQGGGDDRPPLPDSVLARVRGVDGVKDAAGDVSGYAQIVNPATSKVIRNGGAPGLGVNWIDSPTLSSAEIRQGAPPRGPNEIAVDRNTFTTSNLKLGESVVVLTKRAPERHRIVGTFTVGGEDSVGGATVVAFDTPTAQRVLLEPGQLTGIRIAAADGVAQEELASRVAKVLPPNAEAITGKALAEENSNVIKRGIGFFTTFLLIFAGSSVFVSAFIIFNTFTMLIGQRVRELALLRAVGASRRQVRRSVLLEAVVVGLVGATVGLALGVALALGLREALAAFGVELPGGGLVFAPRTVIVAYLIGVVVTSAAAYLPARKAATVPPVAAMRETYVLPTRSLRTRGIAGVATTALGAGLLVAGLFGGGGAAAWLVGAGAGLCFLGVATLSPLLSRPVTRVLGAPLPTLFGTTGKLGRENAMRNPRRTSATASALMIGLAVVSAFAVLGASIKQSTRDVVSDSLGADYFLTAGNFGQGFSTEVARSLAGKPGVELATGLRVGEAQIAGSRSQVLAGDPAALPGVLALQRVEGNLRALRDGAMLVSEQTAKDKGYRVGQQVPVVYPQTGRAALTVVGTYKRNQIAGDHLISLGEYTRHYNNGLDMFVLVKRAPGADPAITRAAVEAAVAAYPNVDVRDQAQFIKQQEDQVNRLLGIVYVLLALTVSIAFFGIINTLALSVIERTREIGLLRAVGMSRRQLRRMIRLESVVISVFGALLGLAIGSVFGWALVSALSDQGLTSFAYPGVTVVVIVLVAAVLGILAAIFPARRAAKMDVLRAIATT